jgi:hypothetical protein
MWMASIAGNFILSADSNDIVSTTWSTNVDTASLVMSMTSNALVTGLIVFRIFEVFREVKGTITSALYEKSSSLGAADGGKLRYIMFVIIESGMALFSIQLARVVCTALRLSTAGNGSDLDAFNIIVVTHEMLNVTKTTSI